MAGNFWNFTISLQTYFKNIPGKGQNKKTKNIDQSMLEKQRNIDQTKRDHHLNDERLITLINFFKLESYVILRHSPSYAAGRMSIGKVSLKQNQMVLTSINMHVFYGLEKLLSEYERRYVRRCPY